MKYLYMTAAAALLGIAAWSPSAEATTLTMGTYDGSGPDGWYESFGHTYTESGYQFYNASELGRWQNGIVFDADPTPSSGLFTNNSVTTTTLTQIGGGSFSLFSIDLDDVSSQGLPNGPLNYTYSLFGGGGGTGSFDIDDVPGYSTLVLNLANLSSFSFTPSETLEYVQFDNVKVSDVAAVPLPAALPLFGAAIGMLGLAKRRRIAGIIS